MCQTCQHCHVVDRILAASGQETPLVVGYNKVALPLTALRAGHRLPPGHHASESNGLLAPSRRCLAMVRPRRFLCCVGLTPRTEGNTDVREKRKLSVFLFIRGSLSNFRWNDHPATFAVRPTHPPWGRFGIAAPGTPFGCYAAHSAGWVSPCHDRRPGHWGRTTRHQTARGADGDAGWPTRCEHGCANAGRAPPPTGCPPDGPWRSGAVMVTY